MSSTDASNIWTEVPEPVGKALESFARGDMDLSALRDMVADVLKGDPGTAEPIHQLLDEELKARRLTIADYGELVDIVGAVVSEQIPTEASDKAPEESGVYRVIDEHTLIPTSITEWGEEVAAGQDDVQKESEADTHSLELEGEKPPANLQEAPSPPQVEIGPGSVLRERFQLEEEVARGSMGIVYRAVDLVKLDAGALDPQVAVKVVSPEFANNKNALRTFQNEVANTQHLSHPHIVHLFELDRDGDRHFITMEWLEGQSLAELLDNTQGSALEHTQTYAIIEQLCDAMIYAHEQGVVHADIKPGNVFLLATGEVKLIDFGIAKTDVEWQGSADMEKFQAVALTPAYAGCERLEHKEPTAQDDLYSLACLIYRLLAGRRVFGSLNALEAEEQDAEVVAIGGMDEKRYDALAKALSFRRDDRQASVREFADEFGRRLAPRDQDAEIWEHPTGDTARMPILNVEIEDAPENFDTNNVDLDLSEAAGATEEPEPDLQQIFEAAARGEAGIEEEMLAGAQGEEIVLSSAPDPVVEPVELAPPQIEKVKELRRRQLPAVNLKAAASIAAAVLLLSVFAWLWSGDAEESLPPQVAAVPETGTSAEVTAGSIEREAPVTEQAAQTESAAEPAATAQPVAEQVPEPQIEQPVEKETVVAPPVAAEPVAEPPVEQVADTDTTIDSPAEQAAETETLVGPPVDQAADTQTTVGPPVEQVAEAQVPDEPEVLEGLVVGSLVGAQTSPAVQASAAEQGATGQQSEPDFDPNEPVPLAELEFVRFVEPEYPARALNRRYDGAVVVEFRVNTEGKTRDIEIVESELPSRFNSPSVAAVKKWRFEPYLREGQPVEVSSRVRLRYAN